MLKTDYSPALQVSDEGTVGIVNKEARDLVVLKYMSNQICMVLSAIDQSVPASSPLYSLVEVRNQRKQRIIVYDPQTLLQNTSLSFVGFVSGKQKIVDPSVDNELLRADTLLVKELVSIPGLLCYSSLEVRPGIWYNLVLFTDPHVKTHLKNGATHRYVAYQLAPRYYEWIRLHSGIMPDGMSTNTLLVQKTKYYTCQALEQCFHVVNCPVSIAKQASISVR
jgi:hypothetical protein